MEDRWRESARSRTTGASSTSSDAMTCCRCSESFGSKRPSRASPEKIRKQIVIKRPRKPRVVPLKPWDTDGRALAVARAVDDHLDKNIVVMSEGAEPISLAEFYEIIVPLYFQIRARVREEGPGSKLASLAPSLGGFMETDETQFVDRLLDTYKCLLAPVLHGYSRIDDRIYAMTVSIENAPNGRPDLTIVVWPEHCRRKTFLVDGEPRPAFQCGAAMGFGVAWAQVDCAQVGVPQHADPLPIYVQNHVFHRIYKRLAAARDQSMIHEFLVYSLLRPVVVRREPHQCWIECIDYLGRRNGYLTGAVVDDAFLVRTFLFLTMQGTPEARLLCRGPRGERRAVITAAGA
jgi:hypothetical protein